MRMLAVAVLSCLSLVVASPAAVAAGPHRGLAFAPGDPAPPFQAPRLVGRQFRMKWDEHAITVVNFWAPWADPCKDEMAALQKLQAKRAKDGLFVVGVLLDTGTSEHAQAFAEQLGVQYTLLRGDTPLSSLWGGVGVMPTSYLVARDGTILRRYVGGTPELIGLIDPEHCVGVHLSMAIAPNPRSAGGRSGPGFPLCPGAARALDSPQGVAYYGHATGSIGPTEKTGMLPSNT
jgi:peroxiredoxin